MIFYSVSLFFMKDGRCYLICFFRIGERRKERLTSRDNQSQQDKAVTGPSPDSEIMSAPPNGSYILVSYCTYVFICEHSFSFRR